MPQFIFKFFALRDWPLDEYNQFFFRGEVIAPMGRTVIRAGGLGIVWLRFPPVCPRRPEVGIHPGE